VERSEYIQSSNNEKQSNRKPSEASRLSIGVGPVFCRFSTEIKLSYQAHVRLPSCIVGGAKAMNNASFR
jgi:hypothetical protein